MRTYLIILILLLFPFFGICQLETKHFLETKVNAATIYLTGAELSRTTQVNLKKGNNLLVFKGLSPYVNAKSVRISGDVDLSVLSISTKTNYLTKKKELPVIKRLKDSLQIIKDELRINKDEVTAYKAEKEMIMANKSIGGTTNGVPISELRQSADFFRERMIDINRKVAKLDKRTAELNQLSNNYNKELREVNSRSSYTETDVLVLLSSESARSSKINLQYLVARAGWVPGYDIKAMDLSQPINLVYKAKVFNNTAVAWENIDIKLSIADPSLSITKPELNPWYLDYYSASNSKGKRGVGYMQNVIVSDTDIKSEDKFLETTVTIGENYDEVDIPDLNTEFEIKSKYSIPADDKPYVVEVEKYTLPATFEHIAVTKMDKGVFVLAKITGWEDLSLVDGDANVYFKGTYLGESQIRTRNVKDTLDLSLGRDDKVLVTRSKLTEYSSKQLIGSKLKETLTFELVAKNNRKNPINIEIFDQVPISKNSEIEVKVLDVSQAEFNPVTGEVKWRYRLQPGESKKMKLSFSIKYPKNQKVEVQQMKRRALRAF
jgi:uncharacterized protein (TIGR02231 family)